VLNDSHKERSKEKVGVHLVQVDAKVIETTEEVKSNCWFGGIALESRWEKAKSDVVVASES
jgi:hypothetical protein